MKVNNECCKTWADAHESGTDNEFYGSLIHDSEDGSSHMGGDLPDIKYCPWCGAMKDRT
jgi:hypothetical protein